MKWIKNTKSRQKILLLFFAVRTILWIRRNNSPDSSGGEMEKLTKIRISEYNNTQSYGYSNKNTLLNKNIKFREECGIPLKIPIILTYILNTKSVFLKQRPLQLFENSCSSDLTTRN